LEKKKKSRHRRLLCWLLVDAAVVAVVLALLLYKPARYQPVISMLPPDPNGDRVHPYISHELMPKFYNGAQRQKPFEMVVRDRGLNEAIARENWLGGSGGVFLTAPQVLFTPGRIVLMGTANVEGAELVVTVRLAPQLTEEGDLHLGVEKVKVGAMSVTLLAKMMARRLYQERLEAGPIETEDIRTRMAASLLSGEPFEPVFEVDGKRVRLQSFDITPGNLTAQFVPVPQTRD
jgi:hypothetical protein